MPVPRASDINRPSIRGVVAGACAALLVPTLVVTTAGAAPSAAPRGVQPVSSAAQSAARAAAAATPAADVRQPTVREVALSGLDRAVLALTPTPHAHEPAEGQLGQLSAPVRTKPAVAATLTIRKPAELVAVSADEPFPAGTTIQMRVKDAAGWSAWSELHVDPEHGPDPASAEARRARVGSDPLLAQDARKVQVRIDTPSGRVPKGTELTLVDAPAAPSDARSRGLAQMATVGQPPIVTRAQWGANESWRSRPPIYTSNLRAGFVHHTASTSSYSPEQAAAQVRAIYAYHTKSLKHSDIDYNFVVDRFGRLYEGRAGGMDQPVLGGHTAGFNEHTFAVVALGNFSTFNPSATDMSAIKDSIARLFAWKLGLHGVNPGSTATLISAGFRKKTRYPRGAVASIPAVSSHQTVNFTACPGKNLQAQMGSIRELAAQYSDVVISAPSPAGTSVVAGQGPVTVASSANRAVTWTADILSPCSDTPVRTFTGSTPGPGPITVTWDLTDSAGAPVLPARYTIRMSGTAADETPVATVTSDVTVAPAPGGAWGPCANASRVVGASGAETSVIWGRITAPAARTVVLSGAGSDPVSLAAGLAAAPLARSLGAPLLLTPRDSLDAAVSGDLQARGATEVLVVGGTDVVSDAVLAAAAGLGATVTRVGGGAPADTAVAVAVRMPAAAPAVLVSPDGSPAHAVAGAALAAQLGGPVLMAAGTVIPPATQAALAGRPSVAVAASTALADDTVAAALPSTSWTRMTGPDAATASAAVASGFPATAESAMVLPDNPAAWVTAPVAASTGAPLLFSPSPSLSPAVADVIRARPAMRATTTTVSSAWLADEVLGATSRVLLGLPWAPPGVALGPGAPVVTQRPATYRVATANAAPEPVKRGRSVKVAAKVSVKSGSKYVSVPAGVPFAVQFKATGKKKYAQVATGTTTKGRATATVTATSSGRWRIVVGSKASGSDYVRVRK